jgi:outer membrane murein-binding lipoprotein Lpp
VNIRLCIAIKLFRKILHKLEAIMADFTKLNTAVSDLSAKVDAMNAKPAPVPAVDDQPAVDALAAQVEAIAAKIPA